MAAWPCIPLAAMNNLQKSRHARFGFGILIFNRLGSFDQQWVGRHRANKTVQKMPQNKKPSTCRSSSKHSKNQYIIFILSPDLGWHGWGIIWKIIRASPSYLLRQTPRIHWDLRWSVEVFSWNFARRLKHLRSETPSCGCFEVLSFFEMSKWCSPKGVAMLLYSAICSGAIVLVVLPWGRHWHRTAKGSTSTYHRQDAVQSDTSAEIGWPNWNLAITWVFFRNKTHNFPPNLHQVSHKDLVVLACLTGKKGAAIAWSQAKLGCNVARNPIPAEIPPKDLGMKLWLAVNCPRGWIMLNLSDLRIWIAFNKEHKRFNKSMWCCYLFLDFLWSFNSFMSLHGTVDFSSAFGLTVTDIRLCLTWSLRCGLTTPMQPNESDLHIDTVLWLMSSSINSQRC